MKAIIPPLFTCLFLFSCSHSNKGLKEYLSTADSIAINYFKGDGSMDTVTAVKIVKDKNVIGQFTALISEEQKKEIKQCGYDGSLHFFKNNAVVQDVDFRMNDAHCMFFTAKYQGEVLQTVLSPEAKQLLESVKK